MNIKTIIKMFSFNTSVKIGNKSFIVPIVKGIGGSNLRLKNDWFLSLMNRVSLPENSTFIDVGVNIGQTLLKFRSRFNNPYLGFEINPNCVSYARNLVKINGIKNISIVPAGLSDKDEVVLMHSNSDIDNCCLDSTVVSDFRPGRYSDDDKSFVPLYRFDNLELLKSGDKLSMVKIDVEGAELEVISGMIEAIKKFRPLILCEILDYHSAQSSVKIQDRASKLYDLMRSLSYDVYLINHSDKNLKFEKMPEIKLVRWTPASLKFNDYLFVPADNRYIDLDI